MFSNLQKVIAVTSLVILSFNALAATSTAQHTTKAIVLNFQAISDELDARLQRNLPAHSAVEMTVAFAKQNCQLGVVVNDQRPFSCVNQPQTAPAHAVLKLAQTGQTLAAFPLHDLTLVPHTADVTVTPNAVVSFFRDVDGDGDGAGDDDDDGK